MKIFLAADVYSQPAEIKKTASASHFLKLTRNTLFDQIDSLKEITPSLEIGTEYSGKIVFWGRDYGLKQFGFQPNIQYKTGKGFYFGCSSNFWSGYTTPLMMSTLSLGYEKQLNSWIYTTINYEHWIFHHESDLVINQFQNLYGIEFIFDLNWLRIEPALYHMYGIEQTLLSDISLKGDYKLFNFLKGGRVFLKPEALMTSSTSPYLLFPANSNSNTTIDETVTSDIAISNFKVVNYELSLSISLNYENFEIKPAYHFAFPEISEGEESIKPFSYFTISFTYTGFTGSKKIRSLFKQLRKL